MALTAVSVYAPPSQSLIGILAVAAVFAVLGGPTLILWVFLGQELRRFLGDSRKLRIFNITCAAVLVVSLYPMLSSTSIS